MPEQDRLSANWRRTLAALANALRLVEDGALSAQDELFVIALDAERQARQDYLEPSTGRLRHVATNLPGDTGRNVTSWPVGTTWTGADAATDVGTFIVQVMTATPNRARQDSDGLLKRAHAVAAAPTPPEAERAVREFRSYVGTVFAGVVTAAELIDAVDVVSRHLHSGR